MFERKRVLIGLLLGLLLGSRVPVASAQPPAGESLAGANAPAAASSGVTRLPPTNTAAAPAESAPAGTDAQQIAQQNQSPPSGPDGSTPGAVAPESPLLAQNTLPQAPSFFASLLQQDRAAADQGIEQRISALEQAAASKPFPHVRLSGFMQLDDGLFSQNANSRATLGDIQNGAGFRRTRLQGLGSVTESTRFSVEMDFAAAGRPSFLDVWGEQMDIPLFGTVRIGQFRQPTTMDAWTSVRHMEFLERSAPFQAMDPFRKVGIMAFRVAEDQRSMLAYSVYATGSTRFTSAGNAYSTLGDTQFASQIGDQGGVSFAIRGTHLLYYDEPAEGRYFMHVGGGFNFSEIGGNGQTGPDARTYEARAIPEFFVGDAAGGGLTAAGTPAVVDSGRILANSFTFYHAELAGNYGAGHFQSEVMATGLNQMGGPTVFYYGAYAQCGWFLTGETVGYNKITGVLDYNVTPFTSFFATPGRGNRGWGAWEVAARWSYLNLSATNIVPANQLSNSAGPPPSPNPGSLNESTVALNWWWNTYTRVQFNWIHCMLENNARGFSQMDIFATRFQIEF